VLRQHFDGIGIADGFVEIVADFLQKVLKKFLSV